MLVCYLYVQSNVYGWEAQRPLCTSIATPPSLIDILLFFGGFFQTDHKTAYRPFCLLDGSPGIMLSILAAGSVFFPGLFLLSKQCLKSIPALRWSERDAVTVSAR